MTAHFESWTARARAVPIEREIDRRGIKLRGGVERVGPCPKCGGEDRFAINTKKGVWNCRGCDVGGDVIELVKHLDDVDFFAACTTLTGEAAPKANGWDRTGEPRKIVAAEFPYQAESGAVRFVVERVELQNADGTYVLTTEAKRKKTFRQKRPDPARPDHWLCNVDGVPALPYRLPELIEAMAAGRTVLVPEGEGKVDLLKSWNIPATCCAGGAKKWRDEHSAFLRGADVVILPDNDDAGRAHMVVVAASLQGVAASIRVLEMSDLPPKGDIVDWAETGGTVEKLHHLIEEAPHWLPPGGETANAAKAKDRAEVGKEGLLIEALSKLRPGIEFARQRKRVAKELGVSGADIDAELEARHGEQGPPPLYEHWIIEPWEEVVDGDALLTAIVLRLKRHVVFANDYQATAVALWILLAWIHEVAVHSPILLVTSAERDSGKTTLLELVKFLTPNAMLCGEITEATLYRGIELWNPTLIVDEADVILIENEPLRSCINLSWTKGSCVPRCIGDAKVPHAFPTFGPKALGMKGLKLPDTTLSRCIVIELKRKRAGEQVERFRSIDDAGLLALRRQAKRWSMDNLQKLDGAVPEVPSAFDNRLAENWWLQFAIADAAGGNWPAKVRESAAGLSSVVEASSTGQKLLADIKAFFDGEPPLKPALERISSADLAAELGSNTDSSWAEWKGGKPITQAQLARLLRPFGIHPELVRLPSGGVLRGYQRSQFTDAWQRYL